MASFTGKMRRVRQDFKGYEKPKAKGKRRGIYYLRMFARLCSYDQNQYVPQSPTWRSVKKRITIFVLLISFVAGGIYLWFKDATLPVDPTATGSKIFVVNRGDPVRTIANNLKNEGLIRDPLAFFILVKRLGIEKTLQAGDFRLTASMDVAAVL